MISRHFERSIVSGPGLFPKSNFHVILQSWAWGGRKHEISQSLGMDMSLLLIDKVQWVCIVISTCMVGSEYLPSSLRIFELIKKIELFLSLEILRSVKFVVFCTFVWIFSMFWP